MVSKMKMNIVPFNGGGNGGCSGGCCGSIE